jgi:hypothetical protein
MRKAKRDDHWTVAAGAWAGVSDMFSPPPDWDLRGMLAKPDRAVN